MVNSGNANAATGERGYRDALTMRDAAADALGLAAESVAVAETGVIGVPLQVATLRAPGSTRPRSRSPPTVAPSWRGRS